MSYDTKIANEGVRSWDKQTNKQTIYKTPAREERVTNYSLNLSVILVNLFSSSRWSSYSCFSSNFAHDSYVGVIYK